MMMSEGNLYMEFLLRPWAIIFVTFTVFGWKSFLEMTLLRIDTSVRLQYLEEPKLKNSGIV